MRSPFKFLDAYTLQDKEFFFGRDQETDALYEMVYKSPLILLYGMSGTGKTSMIQCGLASRFTGPDWYPLWIRRQGDINESLRIALSRATKGGGGTQLKDSISYLFRYYLRPVYLIFDQFEELFVLGSSEEQIQFMQDVRDILASQLPVKIILVMREEFLGQLYDFEKIIPTIFDHRLRVEAMALRKVKQVMLDSFRKFNISLGNAPEDRLDEIIDNISARKSGIHLPYLQVYLDMLYRDSIAKTYPVGIDQELPKLEFTPSRIQEFGEIENVLDKFLEEKKIELQEKLSAENDTTDHNEVSRILDVFVTEEGTKKPVYYRQEENLLKIEPKIKALMPSITNETLSNILHDLEGCRLLRFSDDTIELAHDSLAALIDRKRTDEQRQLNTILRQLRMAFNAHGKTGEYLTRKQLDFYNDFIPLLSLESAIQNFIDKSIKEVAVQENAELERQKRELKLTQQKLAVERQAAKRTRFFTFMIGIVAVIAVGAGGWAMQERDKALQAERGLMKSYESLQEAEAKRLMALTQQQEANYERYLNGGQSLLRTGDFAAAIEQFEFALEFDSTKSDTISSLIGLCNQNIGISKRFEDLMATGNKMLKQGELLQAIDKFQSAFDLEVESNRKQLVQIKINETVLNMLPKYRKLVANAQTFLTANSCTRAKESLKKAKQYEPFLSANGIEEKKSIIELVAKRCE